MRKQKWLLVGAALLLVSLPPIPSVRAQVNFDLISVARPGDPAPVAPQITSAVAPSLNANGDVAFAADGGVYLKSGEALVVVAGYGTPAPGGGIFLSANSPSLNDQGQIAFVGNALVGNAFPPSRSGIFLYSGGTITQVAAVGDPVPGGGPFDRLGFLSSPSINSGGDVAFLDGPVPLLTPAGAINPQADAVIAIASVFLSSGGAITRIARSGEPAPGGGTFLTLASPALNTAGQVAFSATLSPSGSGIYLAAGGTVTKVARTGDPAPGGGTFDSFTGGAATGGGPSINEAGQVAFPAHANGSGFEIVLFSNGGLTLLARTGDPAPGGGQIAFAGSPSLSDTGKVAFLAVTFSPGTFNRGILILLFSNGTLSQVARRGQPSPQGDVFDDAFSPAASGDQVAFVGRLTNQIGGIYLFSDGAISCVVGQGDPVNQDPEFSSVLPVAIGADGRMLVRGSAFPGGNGLFDGTLTPIALKGDPAPGGNAFFNFLNNQSMNESGQVVFGAQLTGGGSGLFFASGGSVDEVARTGDPAPGGGTFFNFDFTSINNEGEVAFFGSALPPRPGGLHSFSNVDFCLLCPGLYLFSNGQFSLLIGAGDPAPGGGTFTSIFPSLNDNGQVAFWASVSAPGRSGIYLWSAGGIVPIARANDPAPGGGAFVFNFPPFPFYAPSLNASGDIAFGARLSTGVSGVYLFSGGTLRRVAGPGDPLPGGGTVFSADSASLNDSGQIAFVAGISGDRVGAFLSSEGVLSKIARPGDADPSGGSLTFADAPILNAQGQVAFSAGTSTGENAVFLATPSAAPPNLSPKPPQTKASSPVGPMVGNQPGPSDGCLAQLLGTENLPPFLGPRCRPVAQQRSPLL